MAKRFSIWWLLLLVIPLLALVVVLSRPAPSADRVERVVRPDAKLQEAAREAQATLDHFVEQLQSAREGQRFAIRIRIVGPQGPEYLWARDPIQTNGSFQATLDQQPITLENLDRGDEITVPMEDVYDWMIVEDGQTQGAFTELSRSANQSPSR
jgi:uncharacterized protein YegJ (DUF2314 family)